MFAIPETMSQSQKFEVGLEWKPTIFLQYPNLINATIFTGQFVQTGYLLNCLEPRNQGV